MMSTAIASSHNGAETQNAIQSIPFSQTSTQDLSQVGDAVSGSQMSQASESTKKRKRGSRSKKQEIPSSTAGTETQSQSQNQIVVSTQLMHSRSVEPMIRD